MTTPQARSIWRAVRAQRTRNDRAVNSWYAGNRRRYARAAHASRRARVKCVRLIAEAFGVPVARGASK